MSRPQPFMLQDTVRVVLHGRLRRKFGLDFNLGVSTAAGAVGALVELIPGFRDEIARGQYQVRRGTFKKGVDLSDAALRIRIVPGSELHIIPVARGRKKGGVGKVILGTVLVVAAVALMQPELAAGVGLLSSGEAAFLGAAGVSTLGLGTSLVGSFTIGSLALAGGAMILGGIMQMISPQPKSQNAASTNSYLLSGLGNTATQGVCVPVVYGRTRVGSVVISAGYSAEDFSPDGSLMQPAESGNGFEPTVTGGTDPAGEPTEAVGTTGPIEDGQGSYSEGGNTGFGGGGGKGGGGGGGGREDRDTLHSKAVVRIIDVLSEGPIGGLVAGAKSIYLNGTPLQANDGSYNFKGITWEIRYGLPDQEPVAGFPASESTTAVGQKVEFSAPITRTITGSSITAARVTVQIPALYRRDTSSGDITGTDLQYRVECRPSKSGGGGWVGDYETVATTNIIGGKCVSPYERSHRFTLPRLADGANTWDVRVTRLTADSTDATNLQNTLWFEYLDEINDHRMIYPNTAYIALTIDAKLFGSSGVPLRQYEIYGRTIAVPLNYDPATRAYATSGPGTSGGTWDLSSVHALPSDNAAWTFLDMMSHPRYGAARKPQHLEAIRPILYQIAQYCDGMVPDGFGGTEPRYTVNVVIPQQDDFYRLMQLMVSAFRGMTYWGAGQIMVSADMPGPPVKLVNQTSVIDGTFSYETTSLATRPNLIRVAYLDASNNYEPAYELVADNLDIAKRGAVSSDLVAWGCTSRGRAHRLGRWAMYLAKRQTETVSYDAPIAQADVRPGQKVRLADPSYIGARMAGRILPTTVSPGENLITNSTTPTLVAADPNTVAASTAVAAKFHTVTRFVHEVPADLGGNEPNAGRLTIALLARTYVVSCYIWLPEAFTGTSLALVAAGEVEIEPFTPILSDVHGAPIGGPDYARLVIGGDLPSSNVVNLDVRDRWQRVAFRVTLAEAADLYPTLEIAAESTQVFYSTGWQVEEDRLTPFITTVSGSRVVRELFIDALYEPSDGHTYTVAVVMPDGGIDDAVPVDAIVSDGATSPRSIIRLGRALAGTPYRQAEWVLTSSEVQPRVFQVLALSEQERNRISFTGVNYEDTRHAEVELGLKFTAPNYSNLPALLTAPLPGPTAVSARDYMTGVGVTQVIRVTVSWTAPVDPRIAGYQVMASATGFFRTWDVANVNSYDIDALPSGGEYTIGVRSVGRSNQTSSWVLAEETITVDGKVDAPAAPGSLTATGGTRRIQLRWNAVANRRDIIQYEIWRSNSAGTGPEAGATKIGVSGGTSFQDQDSATLTPNTTWYYWVRGMALAGELVAGNFAGPASATTTLLIADDLADAIINAAKFASSIKPVLLMTGTAGPGTEGEIAFNTSNEKLYKYTSGAWVEYIQLGGLSGTISTTQIGDGQITTPKLGANAVEADKIAANAVTFGKVAAGAIRVNELAAEVIKAYHLASDFILSNNAQFGNAVIKNAQIDALAVGTSNIASQTVTQTAEDYSNTPYTPTASWVSIADVTTTVPTNGKVLLLVKILSAGAAYGGGSHGGGGGSEGSSGGEGV